VAGAPKVQPTTASALPPQAEPHAPPPVQAAATAPPPAPEPRAVAPPRAAILIPAPRPVPGGSAPPPSPEAIAKAEDFAHDEVVAAARIRHDRGVTPQSKAYFRHVTLPSVPAVIDALIRGTSDTLTLLEEIGGGKLDQAACRDRHGNGEGHRANRDSETMARRSWRSLPGRRRTSRQRFGRVAMWSNAAAYAQ